MNIYNQIDALSWCPKDEAKSIYNTFATAPDYSMPCKVEKLLLCLVYEGCFDDAITLAEGIIAHYASSYTAYLFLGVACDLKGERARAIEAYKQLLTKELIPDKPTYYDQFGIYGLDEDFVHFLIETPFSMDNVNSFTFRLPFEKLFRRERVVRHTQHFSIYYEENSTAAKDIDAICEAREAAYEQVAKYFDFTQDITVDLYLYEDSDTKTAETGHTGAGWAFGKVMVEIYNDKQKMNPVHELVHVIAGLLYGKSVSAFSEGLAVFLVNALGYTQVGDAVNGDYKHQVRTLLAKN
ncbi:MAG: tetratricopeptide repeat protein, partial [Defluviitaleaceae bacterium]|nr:tetratricopeptide repeat protein [Defluviitaleaceae bacterium]